MIIQSGLENCYKTINERSKTMLLVTFNIYLLSQDIVFIEIYKAINKNVNRVRNKSRLNMKR